MKASESCASKSPAGQDALECAPGQAFAVLAGGFGNPAGRIQAAGVVTQEHSKGIHSTTMASFPRRPRGRRISAQCETELRTLILEGKSLDAIRLLRKKTTMPVCQCKQWVDEQLITMHEAVHIEPPQKPSQMMDEETIRRSFEASGMTLADYFVVDAGKGHIACSWSPQGGVIAWANDDDELAEAEIQYLLLHGARHFRCIADVDETAERENRARK